MLTAASLGALLALATVVIHWSPSAPHRLLIYVVALSLFGTLVLSQAHESRGRWILLTPWLIYGSLLGAVAVGPLYLAPWLVAIAAAFAVAALIAGTGGLKGLCGRSAIAMVFALASFAFLWIPLTAGGHRIALERFEGLDLQAHSVLAGVPLHDAWVVHLPGGGENRTLADVRAVAVQRIPADVSTIVASLVGLRMALGDALDLDEGEYLAPTPSYSQLLSAAGQPPIPIAATGMSSSVFRPVFTREDEALIEMSNRTGHAYISAALRPAKEGGYLLYWGVYVEETSWMTPLYMTLIDPFRRHLIYPAALSSIERAWQTRFPQEN